MKTSKSMRLNLSINFLRFFLLASFVILSVFANKFPYFNLDLKISQTLQGIHNPVFSWVMNLVSELGDDFHLQLVIGLAVVLLYYVGYKLEALKAALFAIAGFAVGSLAKLIVDRPRPDQSLVKIHEILTDKSFPSLHVLIYTAFFGYILYLALFLVKRLWLKRVLTFSSIFLLLTIGISRIYLGAHWASDTLGGYLMGAFLISFITHDAKR